MPATSLYSTSCLYLPIRFYMEWKNLLTLGHFTHGDLLQIRNRLSLTSVILRFGNIYGMKSFIFRNVLIFECLQL